MLTELSESNRKAAVDFFRKCWGSEKMVVSSGIYDIRWLQGFVYLVDSEICGLITYVDKTEAIEIISLNSSLTRQGIGTSLLSEIEKIACQKSKTLTLITTNDNLTALKFWQKRGFRITEIRTGAVDLARQKKVFQSLVILEYLYMMSCV